MKYFKISEFDSPDLPGSGQRMDVSFLEKLDNARELAGVPFKITSGYRTEKHNRAVGGELKSSHLSGVAVDIAASNDVVRFKLLSALLKIGFSRLGIGKDFVHVDDDKNKSGGVIWTY